MTEELRQKAEEYADAHAVIHTKDVYIEIQDAYIAGATEITKELQDQLTEKDKQIEELEGQVTRAFEVLEGKRKQIEELKKKLEYSENEQHRLQNEIMMKCYPEEANIILGVSN